MNVFAAFLLTLVLSVAWLRLVNFAAHRGWIDGRLGRKLIHIGTGPLFVLCWLFFPDNPLARYLAALIPLAITLQFLLVGLGVIQDLAAVEAMSRSGDRREILRGPLYYGIIFVVLTVVYWKDSPIGITALMVLCGGDGLADLIGRRFGRRPLPWNRSKTWAGTVGMFAGSWLLSAGVLGAYVAAGVFAGPFAAFLLPITFIALLAAAVETLPLHDVDNITVTLAAVIAGYLVF